MTNKIKVVPDEFIYSLIGDNLSKFLGVNRKEVVVQQGADAQQQVGVYGFLVVYLIDIRATISQFAGKPGNCFPLFVHLLFDKLTYVHSILSMPQIPGLADN